MKDKFFGMNTLPQPEAFRNHCNTQELHLSRALAQQPVGSPGFCFLRLPVPQLPRISQQLWLCMSPTITLLFAGVI